jgi:hypothetical protein
MDKIKFTAGTARSLKPGPKVYAVADADSPLRIRVQPGGSVTYFVFERIAGAGRGAAPVRIKVGPVTLPLAKARKEAHRLYSEMKSGKDPRDDKRAQQAEAEVEAAPLVADLIDAYLEKFSRGALRRQKASPATDSIRGEKYGAERAKLVLGDVPVAEVGVKHAHELVEAMENLSQSALLKAWGTLRRALDYGVEKGLAPINVFAALKAPPPAPSRDRYLSEEELARVLSACNDTGFCNPPAGSGATEGGWPQG